MHALTGYLDFPEARAETVARLRPVTVRSRTDAGCVHYCRPEDVDRPRRFRFSEGGETEKAFLAHRARPDEHQFVTDPVWRTVGAGAPVLTVSARRPVTGG